MTIESITNRQAFAKLWQSDRIDKAPERPCLIEQAEEIRNLIDGDLKAEEPRPDSYPFRIIGGRMVRVEEDK